MKRRFAAACMIMLAWLLFAGIPARAEEPADKGAFLKCLREAISADTWQEEYDLIRGFERAKFGDVDLNETAGLYFQALRLMKDVPQRYASWTDQTKDLAGSLLYCTALLDLSEEYGLELSAEERETLETFLGEYVPGDEAKEEKEGEARDTAAYSFAGHTFQVPSCLEFSASNSTEDVRYFYRTEGRFAMLMFMRNDAGVDTSEMGVTMNTPEVRDNFLAGVLESLGVEEAQTVEEYDLGETEALHVMAPATFSGIPAFLDMVSFLEGESIITVCFMQVPGEKDDLTSDFYRMLDTMDETEMEETDAKETDAAGTMKAIASAKRHETAEDAVQAYLDALKGFDAERISGYYAEEGIETPIEFESYKEEMLASVVEMTDVSAEDVEKLIHTVFDYDAKILSSKEENGKAEVTVRIYHVDYLEYAGKILGDVTGKVFSAFLSDPEMSEEEINALTVQAVAESVDAIKDEEKTASSDFVIACERVGDEWHAELGEDLLQAMTGSFEEFFSEMDF